MRLGAVITRFMPLPHTVPPPVNTVSWNITAMLTRVPIGGRAGGSTGTLPDIATVLGVMLMIAVAIYALWIVASTVHIGREERRALLISMPLKRGGGAKLTYVYRGAALILRKMYVALRRELGCDRCTPRELSRRVGGGLLNFFADLYEKAVYSSEHSVKPEDLESVKGHVLRFLRGSEWRERRS